MRVVNSLRNSTASLVQMFIGTILGFVTRTVFIATLGKDYNGLNALFTSIISMLSVLELGIGTAIVFNMYRAIAAQDLDTQKSLMRFYRSLYRAVALAVALIGLAILPALPLISSYHGIHENITLIYLLFLANTVASYFYSYKRDVFYAYQKSYITGLFDSAYSLLLNTAYIVLLLTTHSFTLYLSAALIFSFAENVAISLYADRSYPWLRERQVKPLQPSIITHFRRQIYGMIYHKLGTFIVFGTDSLIISRFLGLGTLGFYSNYILITNALTSFLNSIINGITASIGDLLTEKNPQKSFAAYKKLSFATFWMYSFVASSIFIVMQPFVTLWIGRTSLLSTGVLLILSLNFYVQGMRMPIAIFQNAAGIFYENRHVPIIESITNFAASLLLVFFFGLEGVLLGTLLSTMILYGYSFPKYVYVPLFRRKNNRYVTEQLRYFLLFLIILALTTTATLATASLPNPWLHFTANLLIALLLPNLLLFLAFSKTKNFQYFWTLIKQYLSIS